MAKIPVVGIGGSLCACHVVLRAKESAGIVDIGAWGARGGGRGRHSSFPCLSFHADCWQHVQLLYSAKVMP